MMDMYFILLKIDFKNLCHLFKRVIGNIQTWIGLDVDQFINSLVNEISFKIPNIKYTLKKSHLTNILTIL